MLQHTTALLAGGPDFFACQRRFPLLRSRQDTECSMSVGDLCGASASREVVLNLKPIANGSVLGWPQASDGTFGVATTRTAPTTLLRSSSKCFLRREAEPWLYYRHEHRPSHRRNSGAGRGTCESHDALGASRWPRPDRNRACLWL